MQLFSLQDQVAHHMAYLRDYALPRQLPTVVLGHSIGAYIAAEACQRLTQAACRPLRELGVLQVVYSCTHSSGELRMAVAETARCLQVWAVFPFLSVNSSCRRQMSIRRLTQLPFVLAAGAGLLGLLLPRALKLWIAAAYTGVQPASCLEQGPRPASWVRAQGSTSPLQPAQLVCGSLASARPAAPCSWASASSGSWHMQCGGSHCRP